MDPKGMTHDEWQCLLSSLEDVAPYYEKVNSLVTFGIVDRWRRRAASLAAEDETVLEIGSGPGVFTKLLKAKEVYCIEPSSEFIHRSRGEIDPSRVSLLRAIGERLPLSDGAVDRVFCVFSFRDFFDREASAREMHRVLKEGGEVVIVDAAKPPPGPLAKLIEMHFRHLVPVLARVAVTPEARAVWDRDPYSRLLESYEAFGTTQFNEKLLRDAGFSDTSTEYLEMKGATMTRGTKPWKSTS